MAENSFVTQFGQVIKEARLKIGMSQEELALASELDRTYISMIERSVKVPTLSTLAKLAGPLMQTPAELLQRAQQLESGNSPVSKPRKTSSAIQLYGTSVSCGKPIAEDHYIEKKLSLDELMIKNPKDTFFIRASGDSMSPIIWDKDLLIIVSEMKPKNGTIVLAQIDNEFTVKRFFKTSKGIRLLADNPSFKEVNITQESRVIICGVVSGVVRSV